MAEILEFKPNPFNGAVIDRAGLPNDPEDFDARLVVSMKRWAEDGFLTIWLDIPKSQSALIPKPSIAVSNSTTLVTTISC